jgi:enamine deaminase RidA (YjgF/YER057c/UK114 family)
MAMEIKRPRDVRAGKQLEWAKGTAVTGAKGFVFLSGITGRDPKTGELVKGGIDAQMDAIFGYVDAKLKELGSGMENICHIRMDWTDATGVTEALEKCWQKYCPRFSQKNPQRDPPAQTGVFIKDLHTPGMLIEITVTAAIP